MGMSNLFRATIALIIIFSVAVVYYFYIWINFKPPDSLDGDKIQIVHNDLFISKNLQMNKIKLYYV